MSTPSFPTSYDPNHPNEAVVALPNSPLVEVTTSPCKISYQAPLSRRGHGPGIVLFEPPSAPSGTKNAHTLDPQPYYKWAEEGYAIAQIGNDVKKDAKSIEEAIRVALQTLDKEEKCSQKDRYTVFAYDPSILSELSQALSSFKSQFCAVVSHGAEMPKDCSITSLSHIFKSASANTEFDMTEALKCPVPDPNFDPYGKSSKTFEYVHVKEKISKEDAARAILPHHGDEVYDHSIAALAHSRTLSWLKPRNGGPWFDLEKIWDEHTWYEFVGRSVANTMGTMVAEPYVNHVPTMIGGVGRKNLTAFYRDHFIFANPPDSALEVVSRTVGIDRIVDEFIFKCKHTTVWEWFLPGVPPTGKELRVPFIAVVCIRGDRLFHEHIWWDQATALRQCGILPTHIPYGKGQQIRLPVAGVECANKLMSENEPSNEMFGDNWGVSAAN